MEYCFNTDDIGNYKLISLDRFNDIWNSLNFRVVDLENLTIEPFDTWRVGLKGLRVSYTIDLKDKDDYKEFRKILKSRDDIDATPIIEMLENYHKLRGQGF